MAAFEHLVDRVAALTRATPVSWRSSEGGYTAAGRWIVRLTDGGSVFVKAATDEMTAEWLRAEYAVYGSVVADVIPHVLGWDDDGEAPILILEDLSAAAWPPPWPPGSIERVVEALDRLHGIEPPPGLDSAERHRELLSGWSKVAAAPGGFLGLSVCSARWLERSLPTLVDAEGRAHLAGGSLLHLDVRSDNVCFAGPRTLLVDWNWACIGPSKLDLACWLPSLHQEGGPPPEELLPEEPELAAMVSGVFAYSAPRPVELATPRIRAVQLAQLRSALPWAARALDLPPPS